MNAHVHFDMETNEARYFGRCVQCDCRAYRALDLARMQQLLARPVLVDLRNIYDRDSVESAGLAYHAVGR